MLLVAGVAGTSSTFAQGLETLGSRASALAAFVAVADDASAVAWNPAGLVSGPIFNLQIDLGRSMGQPGDLPAANSLAGKVATTLVSLSTTPVGVAYYRLAQTSFEPLDSGVESGPDRNSRRVLVRSLTTSHLGVTVQQSIGDYLTVGTTLKLVRGSVGSAVVRADSWELAFDQAESVDGEGATRGDLDAGAMFAAGRFRAGVVVRNITSPEFAPEGANEVAKLERHVRAGVAWADRWPGISRTVLSFDADVTRVPHPAGERRDVAAGIERWWRAQRIGTRAGVRASTLGDARAVVSAGGSYGVWSGTYVDAFVTAGTRDDRGWGIAVRLTY
jgi:F plasmid transfer operon, TraF, protein